MQSSARTRRCEAWITIGVRQPVRILHCTTACTPTHRSILIIQVLVALAAVEMLGEYMTAVCRRTTKILEIASKEERCSTVCPRLRHSSLLICVRPPPHRPCPRNRDVNNTESDQEVTLQSIQHHRTRCGWMPTTLVNSIYTLDIHPAKAALSMVIMDHGSRPVWRTPTRLLLQACNLPRWAVVPRRDDLGWTSLRQARARFCLLRI